MSTRLVTKKLAGDWIEVRELEVEEKSIPRAPDDIVIVRIVEAAPGFPWSKAVAAKDADGKPVPFYVLVPRGAVQRYRDRQFCQGEAIVATMESVEVEAK